MAKMYTKYINYDGYKNLNSTDFFMLCELIDNSISSFLKLNSNSLENFKNCFINIILDESNTKNRKLIIEDNAYGIKKDIFNTCLEIGNTRNGIKDSDLNAFGIGMKQAGFYLGEKLLLKTINLEEKIYQETFIDVHNNDLNNDAEFVITTDENKKHLSFYDEQKSSNGTVVEISYLRKSLMPNKQFDENFPINISSRYYDFLKAGIKIFLVLKDKDKKIRVKEIEAKRIPFLNILNYYDNKKISKRYNTSEKIKQKMISTIQKVYEDKNANSEIKDELIYKISNSEDFSFSFSEEIINNIKVTGTLGWIEDKKFNDENKQAIVRMFGLNIFQSGRAIYCSPTPQSKDPYICQSGTYKRDLFPSELSGGETYKRRWVGYLDFTDILKYKDKNNNSLYVMLDSNKRGLRWVDSSAESNFTRKVTAKMDLYNPYLSGIVEAFAEITKSEIAIDKNRANNDIENSCNSDFIKEKTIIESGKMLFKLTNSESEDDFEITVIIDQENDGDDVIKFSDVITINKNEIFIKFNPRSLLWKPILNFDDRITTEPAIYYFKMGLVFALSEIYTNPNLNKTCDLFKEMDKKDLKVSNDQLSFSKVFSAINKFIFENKKLVNFDDNR